MILLTLGLGLALLVLISLRWRSHVLSSAQQEQRKKELEACLANSRDWPPPNSPKGWKGRRAA